MSDRNATYTRLRHTATGALAALAAVGAIVGTAALAAQLKAKPQIPAATAAQPGAKTPAPAATAAQPGAKTPAPAATAAQPGAKTPAPASVTRAPTTKSGNANTPRSGSSQPFLTAVQQLVDDGTISATEGQTLDNQIQAGQLDPQTLASSGFSQTQLAAVQLALANAKRALAPK